MIEADTIEKLPPQLRIPLQQALATVYQIRVIQTQIQKEKEKILGGDADQPVEEVAAALLVTRRTIQALQSFEQVCYAAYKETQNA